MKMRESKVLFSGIMPALVSCLDSKENVCRDGMKKLVEWHLSEGVDGFYLCGGTGEGPVLQADTRMEIMDIAKETVGNRGKLIAHVGAVDLKTAVKLSEHARKAGMDAISSVPPFFFQYGEREIIQYYSALAEASGLPVIMYASPLANTSITCEMVEKLMKIPNMTGIKWTNYDYYTLHRIKEIDGGNINVINGPDETLLCGLIMGADGGIGATYNVMPRLFTKMYSCYKAGNISEAQELQYKANKLIRILLRHGVVAGIKDILNELGYACGYQVYPQKRYSAEEHRALWEELKSIDYEKEFI